MVVRYEMVYTGTSLSLQIETDKGKGGKKATRRLENQSTRPGDGG